MSTQKEEILTQLKVTQRRHRREYWLENLVHTVFNANAMTLGEEEVQLSEEDLAQLKEQEEQMKKMEAEMEREKQELLEKGECILHIGITNHCGVYTCILILTNEKLY